MIKCEICLRQFNSVRSLNNHIRSHSMSSKDYYDAYILKENDGKCKICKSQTSFVGLEKGYKIYCSKICQNIGNSVVDLSGLDMSIANTFKNTKEFYDHFLKKDGEGICFCGKPTKFSNMSHGYREHCSIECINKNPLTIEKSKATSMKHYGVDNPRKSKIVDDRIKSTCVERYGAENVFASEYGKNKIKETFQVKYGVDNPNKCEDIKLKVKSAPENGKAYIYYRKSPNGKIYIGQTKNIKKRWRRKESSYIKSDEFYQDLLKYGWDNFEHDILEECKFEDRFDRESFYIMKNYKTCYNRQIERVSREFIDNNLEELATACEYLSEKYGRCIWSNYLISQIRKLYPHGNIAKLDYKIRSKSELNKKLKREVDEDYSARLSKTIERSSKLGVRALKSKCNSDKEFRDKLYRNRKISNRFSRLIKEHYIEFYNNYQSIPYKKRANILNNFISENLDELIIIYKQRYDFSDLDSYLIDRGLI